MMAEFNPSGSIIKTEQIIHPVLISTGFKCEYCDKEFYLKDRLFEHISESHHEVPIDTIVKTEKITTGTNMSLVDSRRHHMDCQREVHTTSKSILYEGSNLTDTKEFNDSQTLTRHQQDT
eukprot:950219_1